MAQRLRTNLAGVKLLAMGQTVFWDEPVKALLRRVLDELAPEVEMLVGIHDTDYFSRLRQAKNTGQFLLTGHDDGPTRDVWVAAAEGSQLFGSETVINRALLSEHGVVVEKAAGEGDRDAFLAEATAAWGWRGVAIDAHEAPICAAIRVPEALPKLVELLRWAASETAATMKEAQNAVFGQELVGELARTAAKLPSDATLPDLYERLSASYWKRLLGRPSARLRFTRSSRLFRFNTQTADLPRFRFLDLFLNPQTRDAARRAYNEAVRDSDIYALEKFSDVALPFDLVLLRAGKPPCRGTICVADNEVAILGPDATVLHTDRPPTSVAELAALIERHCGPDAVLVGKALTLVPMMLSEWVFVLHKFGSAYVPRTQQMVAAMRAAGLSAPLHPILRVELDAWSALADVPATFRLPPHLAQAFNAAEVTASEFASRHAQTIAAQEQLLTDLKKVSSPQDLTKYLSHDEHPTWLRKTQAYVDAHGKLLGLSREIERLRHKGADAWTRAKAAKTSIQGLEQQKGQLVKQKIKPLRRRLLDLPAEGAPHLEEELKSLEAQGAELDARIASLRQVAQADETQAAQSNEAHRALEQSPEVVQARAVVAEVEREAQRLRLRLVRNALLTTHGLPYAAARPCWWWFPVVDPSGRWFDALMRTAKFWFEEV